MPNTTPEHFSQHEIRGLEELLKKMEQLPVIEPVIKEDWVDQARPLLSVLRKEMTLPLPEVISRCPISIPKPSKKYPNLFKIQIPVTMIPIPDFANVSESAWVDVGAKALEDLSKMGEEFAYNVAVILNTITHFENANQVIVRADGVICKNT